MENERVWAENIRIESSNGFAGVFAGKAYQPGDRLLPLRGHPSDRGDRYSIQVGVDRHLKPGGSGEGDGTEASPWKFLNHSCDPNLEVDLDEACFVARREIAKGEELSFNYLTTEWEMASPFDCICGSSTCFGSIRGFKHLPREEQERLLPAAAPHIQILFERTKVADSSE